MKRHRKQLKKLIIKSHSMLERLKPEAWSIWYHDNNKEVIYSLELTRLERLCKELKSCK